MNRRRRPFSLFVASQPLGFGLLPLPCAHADDWLLETTDADGLPALDAWRFGVPAVAQEIGLPAVKPWLNKTYCDSIGCDVPQRVGNVEFAVLQLRWGRFTEASPWMLEENTEVLDRRHRRGSRRCGAIMKGLRYDWRVLQSPESLAMAAAPARRLTFAAWEQRRRLLHDHATSVDDIVAAVPADSGTSLPLSSSQHDFSDTEAAHDLGDEPFMQEHGVFRLYGSLHTLLGFHEQWRSTSMAMAHWKHDSELCSICANLLNTLVEVDQWGSTEAKLSSSRLQRYESSFQDLLQMVQQFSVGFRWDALGAWRRCILWALVQISAHWRTAISANDGEESFASATLSGKERECVMKANLAGGEEDPRAALNAAVALCGLLSVAVFSGLAKVWRAAAIEEGALTTFTEPSVLPASGEYHWRLCGPFGSLARRILPGGRLRATVLGVWGDVADDDGTLTEKGANASMPFGSWMLEVALFFDSVDECVHVDGQRLFQTHPSAYLVNWICMVAQEGASSPALVAQDAGVASYSGTIAVVRCRFASPLPFSSQRLWLEIRALRDLSKIDSTSAAADQTAWRLKAIPLCRLHCSWRRHRGRELHPEILDTAQTFKLKPGPPSGALRFVGRPNVVRRSSNFERGITVCSEVLYKMDGTYRAQVLQQWLEYHRLIGVDHFVLYDRDGSLNAGGMLDSYQLSGYVTYFPRFPRWALSRHHEEVLLAADRAVPSHAAPDAQAAAHCLYANRGLSEWVAFLHSPDEYLSSAKGLRNVEAELLRPLRPLRDAGLAAVDVSAVYFTRGAGPRVRPSPWLLGRYVHRAIHPIELPGWGSHVAGFLNRFGSPLVDPLQVSDLVSAHFPRVAPSALYLDDVPQDFVRSNHYGEAFAVRDIGAAHGEAGQRGITEDLSALWAEAALASLGLPGLPPAPEPV